jgi:hypothetical protein
LVESRKYVPVTNGIPFISTNVETQSISITINHNDPATSEYEEGYHVVITPQNITIYTYESTVIASRMYGCAKVDGKWQSCTKYDPIGLCPVT